jgi:hypothetical protein
MKRRSALQLTATILGGTIFGSELFLSGCTGKTTGTSLFSEDDLALLDEIGEAILPETEDSPGAMAANIGLFISAIVSDCYEANEQLIFLNGLHGFNQKCKDEIGKEFKELTGTEKLNFLEGLGEEARNGPEDPPHYFAMMKQLTVWGYFTSEQGATRALRYNPVPGRYIGCFPYENGDKAWAI